MLKENLLQLDKRQLKLFYAILVHHWASRRVFISKQNFHNLWCDLNYHCSEVDESFPDPFDDYDLLRSFCHAHPYYFIDILSPELIINLFCSYLDDRLDILAMIVNKLNKEGLRAAYEHSKKTLDITEDIDDLVAQTEEHVNLFS